MKKLIIILLSLALCLTGCSTDALSGYIKAFRKTKSISSGRLQLEASVDMDFQLDQLTAEQQGTVQNLEHMDFASEVTYDFREEADRMIAKSYGNFGGMGIDSTFYLEGDKMNLYLPMLGGYLDLPEAEDQDENEVFRDFSKLSEPVLAKFLELLTAEDIMKGKRTYITTKDGQIKTTVYTVNMSEEQLKQLMEETIRIIEEDNIDLGKMFGIDTDQTDIPKELRKWKDRFALSGFTSTAYVDFDGRLVKQDLTAELTFKKEQSSMAPIGLRISGIITFSGLGEKQAMDFPEVTEDMYLEDGWSLEYRNIHIVN